MSYHSGHQDTARLGRPAGIFGGGDIFKTLPIPNLVLVNQALFEPPRLWRTRAPHLIPRRHTGSGRASVRKRRSPSTTTVPQKVSQTRGPRPMVCSKDLRETENATFPTQAGSFPTTCPAIAVLRPPAGAAPPPSLLPPPPPPSARSPFPARTEGA
jgi:hypothetical protein